MHAKLKEITQQLSELASQQDFVLVYGELVAEILKDIESHGYGEKQAAQELIRMVRNAASSREIDKQESSKKQVTQLEEQNASLRRVIDRVRDAVG
jgi:predicted secreted Zn-dependent protease